MQDVRSPSYYTHKGTGRIPLEGAEARKYLAPDRRYIYEIRPPRAQSLLTLPALSSKTLFARAYGRGRQKRAVCRGANTCAPSACRKRRTETPCAFRPSFACRTTNDETAFPATLFTTIPPLNLSYPNHGFGHLAYMTLKGRGSFPVACIVTSAIGKRPPRTNNAGGAVPPWVPALFFGYAHGLLLISATIINNRSWPCLLRLAQS
jgi:hypothetical protein